MKPRSALFVPFLFCLFFTSGLQSAEPTEVSWLVMSVFPARVRETAGGLGV